MAPLFWPRRGCSPVNRPRHTTEAISVSRARFPTSASNGVPRFVEDGKFATAGGVSSGIDLALRVVERYVGRDIAAQVADGMEYQGKGWLNPNSNDAYATMPEFNEAHPVCPLCFMDGDRSLKTTYKGKTYYFCAPSEKEFFDKHLDVFERFLAEDASRQPRTERLKRGSTQ